MKRIQLYTLALVTVLSSATSCNEDLLNVDPVGEYLSENYFLTDDQVFGALIAAYDPMSWSMAYGQWISPVMLGEIRSDNAHAGGDPSNNDQPGWQELDDFRETNTNTILQPLYRKNYIGIFRANTVINNVEITSPSVTRYKAEARFLRAYYHFELLKNFGPIPVVLETLTPEDVDLPRNSMLDAFLAIETDLKEAINVLPTTVSAQETGRVTKGAAQALLGKIYLYWADMFDDDPALFDLAAEQLEEVVASGQYSLMDDYGDLWEYGTKNPVESVLELQHNNLWTSDWSWFEGIDGNGIVQLCGIRGLCNSHPLYQAGWGFMPISEDLYNTYEADDIYRRDRTVASVALLSQQVADAGATGCANVVDATQNNPVDYTGYFQIKYANYKAYEGNNVNGGDPNLTKDANVYVIRYADVLLMLAEALHRGTGSDAEAMTYVDLVRERGAGPGDNTGNFRTVSELMTDNGWTLLEAIWYERRIELALEGDRWHDLVRSGRADESLFADDEIRSQYFSTDKIWLPISIEETSVATGLTTYPDPSLFN